MESTSVLDFPPFRLDPRAARLYRDDEAVALRPKAFALLHHMALHAGLLLTKDALLESVWPDRVVSEGGLSELVRELRSVLGDDARAPRYIETVHGRGYRFIRQPGRAPQSGAVAHPARASLPLAASLAAAAPPVGRAQELARLHTWLGRAEQGVRQLVFVTGEPGIGKTTLIEAFGRQLATAASRPDDAPRFVRGQCIEQYGAGEAYLPVLEALGRLARQIDHGQLLDVLRRYAPTWLAQLPALLDADELERLQHRVLGATRERMLREMAEALEVITAATTLVLVLEDLHWSDYSTLDLISFVAQRHEPARLMVVASFRPVEVYAREHPLKAVKQELQMRRQCVELALTCLSESEVAEYLAGRFAGVGGAPSPERLAPVVHRRTDGHPLFMVNVADYVAAQKFVGLPEAVEESIPDGVRQMIEKQIERLPVDQQRLLEAASVAGNEFSAASVAAGLGDEDLDAVEQGCAELARRAQFLTARGSATWPDGTLAARYGFIHALYQNVLYFRVTPGRRARVHLRIGLREEQAHAGQAGEIAGELAAHFDAGQDYERALTYLMVAGERAVRRCANREAIDLFARGHALLAQLPDSSGRRRRELLLHIAQGAPLIHSRGYAADEVVRTYARARELHAEVGEPAELFSVLWGLWLYYVVRGDHPVALDIGRQLQAHERRERLVFPWAHYATGCSLFWLGELTESRATLEHALAVYERATHATQVSLYSQDPKTVSMLYRAWVLWLQGCPDQALACCEEAALWAESLAHPFSLAFAHDYCAVVHYLRREPATARARGEAAIAVSEAHGFPFWAAWGRMMCAWARAHEGAGTEGIAMLRAGLADYEATGAGMGRTLFLAMLADACRAAGDVSGGLAAITEAYAHAERTQEQAFSAELHRLEGELVLAGDGREASRAIAETCFTTAIDCARRQGAHGWELRAVLSLACLRLGQGRGAESRAILAACRAGFTDGLGTADLLAAGRMLVQLGEAQA